MEYEFDAEKYSTSVTGAKIAIEADTKDASNHVLRFDGTGITDGIVSNANYNNVIKNGKIITEN